MNDLYNAALLSLAWLVVVTAALDACARPGLVRQPRPSWVAGPHQPSCSKV